MEAETHYYRLTYKDWLAGVRLARRRDLRWMLRYVASWLIPILILYLDIANIWNWIRGGDSASDSAIAAVVLSLLIASILGYRVFRLRHIYNKSILANHPEGLALAFNAEYFVSGLPGRSEGRFFLSALYDFVETDRIALVYTSKREFVIIPKNAMPEESWTAFRTLMPHRA